MQQSSRSPMDWIRTARRQLLRLANDVRRHQRSRRPFTALFEPGTYRVDQVRISEQ